MRKCPGRSFLVPVLTLLSTAVTNGAYAESDDELIQQARRRQMVATQIEGRGINDPAVLTALRDVPRHRFVSRSLRRLAYEDQALPIGEGQSISQPYIVARMTTAVRPTREMKVLEIGTGSGYQAAVIGSCVREVYTVEVLPALGRRAETVLKDLGYRNVHVRIGDGFDGWAEHAPYDAVLLTAAPRAVPQPLLDQLRVGGRLVAPVGQGVQDLVVITRTERRYVTEVIDSVLFVPMTGKAALKQQK